MYEMRESHVSCFVTFGVYFYILYYFCGITVIAPVSHFRLQAKEMFMHGYNSYMKYAYPHDELMPLSCKGRQRGVTPPRGDIDDALGK